MASLLLLYQVTEIIYRILPHATARLSANIYFSPAMCRRTFTGNQSQCDYSWNASTGNPVLVFLIRPNFFVLTQDALSVTTHYGIRNITLMKRNVSAVSAKQMTATYLTFSKPAIMSTTTADITSDNLAQDCMLRKRKQQGLNAQIETLERWDYPSVTPA